MTFRVVQTDQAPAAIGPYSQATIAGGVMYASGQIPLSPDTGEIVGGGVATQAKQVLENLKAVVEEAGASLQSVVKVTIYITDMSQFAVVNEVYGQFFDAPFPARACVEVSALPKGVEVEMDAIAHVE
ncbi:MAG: RidA family protein [Planctomycetota bacterium]